MFWDCSEVKEDTQLPQLPFQHSRQALAVVNYFHTGIYLTLHQTFPSTFPEALPSALWRGLHCWQAAVLPSTV